MLADTHAHLDFDDFDHDRDDVVARARDAGVTLIINPGCDIATSRAAVALAERYDCVYAAVGVHPNSAARAKPSDLDAIARLAEHPRVVAIGEIGLDYYRDRTPRDLQVRWAAEQLTLAASLDLPVIVHFREVGMDGVDLVGRDLFRSVRGVFHCFSGTVEFARELVSWGWCIGFDGPLTYRKSDRPDVARALPADRCLLETDAPFLTPAKHRGERNEPAYVREIAERFAAVTETDVADVIAVTGGAALDLFAPGR